MASSITDLPNELLYGILHQGFASEFEFSYLWTTLRNVCRSWRSTVDDLVTIEHLDKMFLTYRLENTQLEYGPITATFWLSFSALDEVDRRIAVLRPDETLTPSCQDLGWLDALKRSLDGADAKVAPAHIFSCIRHVNDTELCEFELRENVGSESEWEIRLDWRATITKLMAEDKYRQELSRRWIEKKREQASSLSATETFAHGLQMQRLSFGQQRDESFRIARTRRITNHLKPGLINDYLGVSRAMVRKADDIESHQSRMNQFSF